MIRLILYIAAFLPLNAMGTTDFEVPQLNSSIRACNVTREYVPSSSPYVFYLKCFSASGEYVSDYRLVSDPGKLQERLDFATVLTLKMENQGFTSKPHSQQNFTFIFTR